MRSWQESRRAFGRRDLTGISPGSRRDLEISLAKNSPRSHRDLGENLGKFLAGENVSQAASLVVCSKYKEMYGKIFKSLTIVKLYRRMSMPCYKCLMWEGSQGRIHASDSTTDWPESLARICP